MQSAANVDEKPSLRDWAESLLVGAAALCLSWKVYAFIAPWLAM